MSSSTTRPTLATTPAPTDPTFRAYTSSQAQSYVTGRSSYPAALYDVILSHHISTGGTLGVLLDVGCGPGNVTRYLAPHFEHAYGLDPGEQMINVARQQGGESKGGRKICFEVGPAEDLRGSDFGGGEGREGGFIDGGYGDPYTPNAMEVQRILFRLERETLSPFELPQNRLSRDMYDNLLLPWDVSPPVTAFPQSQFVIKEWDRDGVLTDGKEFFEGSKETSLEELERALGTASMVTRWREAHPELAGTEQDCVREMMGELREALGGRSGLVLGSSVALLMFKIGRAR